MPRPQFTLKAMLTWLVLLPAVVGALAASLRTGEPPDGPVFLLAGALFGACVGSYRSSSHAALGAFFGLVLAWPTFLVVLFALMLWGLVNVD